MGEPDVYIEINDVFVNESNKLLKKIIIKKQSEYQKENYPDAKADTSMKCVICGGSYTPRSRFVHNRTNKHIKSIDKIKDYIDS